MYEEITAPHDAKRLRSKYMRICVTTSLALCDMRVSYIPEYMVCKGKCV